MKKYIKYPLPVKIDWSKEYMQHGGVQMLEILQKEFPMRRLLEEHNELGIGFSQLARLFSWLKHNCDINKVKEEFGYDNVATAKSFFYKGAGILAVLYKKIDKSPVVTEGQFESRYNFIKYEIIKNEIGTLVISRINENNWSNDTKRITNYDIEIMEHKFYYDAELNRLEEEHPIAQQLKDMYEVTNQLN